MKKSSNLLLILSLFLSLAFINPAVVKAASNNLLQRYELLSSDGVQTLPALVQDVSTVALKYTGTNSRVYEWNVFAAPLTAPLPTTITWIQGGDQVVKLEWTANGAESYNVKRATSPGGPYATIANVKGTSYSDNTVNNGTTYYYVVSAVNQAGESGNSPEVCLIGLLYSWVNRYPALPGPCVN
ncbi:hypothetical protein [Paenibacillus glucanolyticus]|uniref:hypothetical protein n=1 Tax=Paenibacillus glucanolyticus TaxID=59843 RepID=UPI00096C9645|nr:hypothetical protein [Paenibacillus glucanolyticus]OMF81794.1 hypothetical protein BK142_04810 [Paenibacillus glucanolyticus]